MTPTWLIGIQELRKLIIENIAGSATQVQGIAEILNDSVDAISMEKYEDMDAALNGLASYMASAPQVQVKVIADAAQILRDKVLKNEEITCMVQKLADTLKKSAEKSAESANSTVNIEELSKRQKQILACMQQGKSYRTEEVAQMIGLRGPRTRQLLNELVVMNLVSCTAVTKNRRYVKE